jgi:hypothetical protein
MVGALERSGNPLAWRAESPIAGRQAGYRVPERRDATTDPIWATPRLDAVRGEQSSARSRNAVTVCALFLSGLVADSGDGVTRPQEPRVALGVHVQEIARRRVLSGTQRGEVKRLLAVGGTRRTDHAQCRAD